VLRPISGENNFRESSGTCIVYLVGRRPAAGDSEYGPIILPLTVLRRLDCVLEPTKATVLAELDAKTKARLNAEPFLLRKAQQGFYNTDPLDLGKLIGDQDNIRANLIRYIEGFSPAVRDIFEQFEFNAVIDRLAKTGLLYQVAERFARINLHPDKVDNTAMGGVF
jgi:type I restriction enzyme M protein